MVKTSALYLALRLHGHTLIVLRVRSFDFFRLGLTEVYSASPILAHFRGRQFSTLGNAAQDIHSELFGRSSGHSDYVREYEAYCIADFDDHWDANLGRGVRRIVSRGKEIQEAFSPGLTTTRVELAPDTLTPGGRWVACCELMPIVPLGVSDADAVARLEHEMSEGRHHREAVCTRIRPAATSREATAAPAGGSSHRERFSSPRDGDGGGRERGVRPPSSGDARSAVQGAPKRSKFSTKAGLCVYWLHAPEMVPHEIMAHWLVEHAVPGESMKVLKLRPLHPPGAAPVDVPHTETITLDSRFQETWRQYKCDDSEDVWMEASNKQIRAAHLEAVRLQAKVAKQTEEDMFNHLRWKGELPPWRAPSELRRD